MRFGQYLVTGVTFCSLLLAGCAQLPKQADGATRPLRDTAKSIAMLVSAHPDDEMQMWSLAEADRTAWPLFVFLNRGESTAACNNKSSKIGEFETGTLEAGEQGPQPVPADNYTPACAEARIHSTLDFLTMMSEADPHFPGQWVPKQIQDIPNWPKEWCKNNPDKSQCLPVDHKPLVWIDAQYRGAAVFFDAGDYDVTKEEAAWAVNELIQRRKEWGLSWAPISVLASNYTNGRGECIIYDHPDHDAVQHGLAMVVEQRDDLDESVLALATCSSDPNITRRHRLSDLAIRAAFGAKDSPSETESGHTDDAGASTIVGKVNGAHGLAYGWLWPGHFPLGRERQTALFHADQTFATKPGDLRPAPEAPIETPTPAPSAQPDEQFGADTPAVGSPNPADNPAAPPGEPQPNPVDQAAPPAPDQPAASAPNTQPSLSPPEHALTNP